MCLFSAYLHIVDSRSFRTMSATQIRRNRVSLWNVRKFISAFPDLKYDGSRVICLVCNRDLLCWKRWQCQKHVNSATHKCKKSGQQPYETFIFDLIFMLSECNLPFYTLKKKPFRTFWEKYNPNWKLPAESTLRKYLPRVRERLDNRIRHDLNGKQLWLTIDESSDSRKNSVVSVIVRPLNPHESSSPYLLACKRVKQCTADSIKTVICTALQKFDIAVNQILMFVTDDGCSSVIGAGRLLKHLRPNLLHVTCVLHSLQQVAETIRSCYLDVDALIVHTKAVFVKSPKRIRQFHETCPDIPEPPQPVLARWETWLEAAFYYHRHFQKVGSLVLQFNPKEAAAIKKSQLKFQNQQVERDLQTIFMQYQELAKAFTLLQNSSLSLGESFRIIDNVQATLESTSDNKCVCVREKFHSLLVKNANLTRLRQIYNNSVPADPFTCLKDSFNYASITSLAVQQSFSSYKNIFTPLRTNLKEITVETYAMLQMYSRAHADT